MKRFEASPLLLIILATACLVNACVNASVRPVYIEEEKKTAERAVEQVHARLNAGQYEAVYDDAADYFKAASPDKDETVAAMGQTREQTGRILSVKRHMVNYVQGDPIPVRAVYNLECEKGDFTEWMAFIISKDGKNALLAHYQIFSGSSPIPDEQARPTVGK